jgi:hypothetical protein
MGTAEGFHSAAVLMAPRSIQNAVEDLRPALYIA